MTERDVAATPWSESPRPRRSRKTSKPRERRRVGPLVWGIVGVAALILATAWLGSNVWNRIWLDRHGVLTYAPVDAIHTDSAGSEGGATTYVTVRIAACSCEVELHVGSDRHPVDSWIAVRYDPNQPRHAEVAEDVPLDDDAIAVLVVLIFVVAAFGSIKTRQAAKAWRARAAEMGWTFEPRLEPFDGASEPRSLGSGRLRYRNALVGERHGVGMIALIVTVTKGRGESSSTTSAFTVAMQLEDPRPDVWIGPVKASKRAEAVGPVVGTGDRAFDDVFAMRSSDAGFARTLAGDRLRTWFLSSPNTVSMEVRESRLYVFSSKSVKPATLDALLDSASMLERSVRDTPSRVLVPIGGREVPPTPPLLPTQPPRPDALETTRGSVPPGRRVRRIARFVVDAAISLIAMSVIVLIANGFTDAFHRDPERTSGGSLWPLLGLYVVLASAWFRFRRSTDPLRARSIRLAVWVTVVIVSACVLDVAFSPSR